MRNPLSAPVRSKLRLPTALLVAGSALAWPLGACGPETTPAMVPVGPTQADEPKPAAPAPPDWTAMSVDGTGIEPKNLDRTVQPCDDFFKFACGGWLASHEIPPDRSRWGSFYDIEERNLAVEREILEADAAGKGDPADPFKDSLGALYGACMDEPQIEKSAAGDLRAELKKLDGIKNVAELADAVARLHREVGAPMFNFGSGQDFKDATQVIGIFDQGGLGLPDRDYYLKDDGKFPDLRAQYQVHVAKMFELAGEKPAAAADSAKLVMKIEKSLAEAQLSRVDRRDPAKIYHRIELAGLEKAAPKFPWPRYLKELGRGDVTQLNVTVPEAFTRISELLEKLPIGEWKVYLKWQLIHAAAPMLSKAFLDENFRFFGQALNGQKELQPRWKRCTELADRLLGEALGAAFVRRTFGDEGKRTTLEMIREIEGAMGQQLGGLPWMDEVTRKEARGKLDAIANKIGFPDKFRDYSAVKMTRESNLKNFIAGARFEVARDLAKIGKPLDRTEWLMTPPTVNAYYDPSMNEMVFPAGILQAPFYARSARPAVNFGAIGMVMGHELTHGFDDEGRKFDGKGNLRDWWSPSVNQDFERRAGCVATQFDGYVAVDDLHVNGKLTLGENIADLGGIKLAYHAYQTMRARSGGVAASSDPKQFTDEQLFFLGAAQAWCSKTRDENARVRVTTDPHSPPVYRIDGPMSNLPEFQAAFQCGAGQKMVRADRCSIW